jgi:hypothetical protein
MAIIDIVNLRGFVGPALGSGGPGSADGHKMRLENVGGNTGFAGVGIPAPVFGIWVENVVPPSSGFVFATGAGLATITWPGPGTRLSQVIASGAANMSNPSGGSQYIDLQLGVNGSVIPGAISRAYVNNTRLTTFDIRWTLELAPGDVLELFFVNRTFALFPTVTGSYIRLEVS